MSGCKGVHCPGCGHGAGGSGGGGAGGLLVLVAIIVAVAAFGRPLLRVATDVAEVVTIAAITLAAVLVGGGLVAGVVIVRRRRRLAGRQRRAGLEIGSSAADLAGRPVAALPAPRDDLTARQRDRVTTRVVATKVTSRPTERSE